MRALVVLAALAGCWHVTTTPITADVARPPKTYASPGESFAYVGKLFGIPAARLDVAVGDAGEIDGRRAVIIRSRAFNELLSIVTELEWTLTTTLELEHGLPLRAVEEARLVFAGDTDHERDEREWRDERQHDVHSTLCMMRAWQAEPGTVVTFELAVGGGHFPMKVREAGRELVGNHPAVRFDGKALDDGRAYHFTVWISDDLDRVPLLMRAETKWGDIDIELVEYSTTNPHLL